MFFGFCFLVRSHGDDGDVGAIYERTRRQHTRFPFIGFALVYALRVAANVRTPIIRSTMMDRSIGPIFLAHRLAAVPYSDGTMPKLSGMARWPCAIFYSMISTAKRLVDRTFRASNKQTDNYRNQNQVNEPCRQRATVIICVPRC